MSPTVRKVIIGVAVVVAVVIGLARLGNRGGDVVPASAPAQPAAVQITEDAEPKSLCPEKGVTTKSYGALDLIVERTKDDLCGFTVSPVSNVKGVKLGEDEGALAISAQFVDLNADVANELIVVADSGGSGLHANTFVFTQRPVPHLIEMYDGCATSVERAADGRRALKTCTLGMNMMDGVCNGCSPRPYIFYMLEGGKLVQRNTLFVADYDKRIAAEEKDIKPEEAEAFLKSESSDDHAFQDSPTRDAVMRIAADYIYSGREPRAKAAIEKYWPPWDRERIFEDLGGHPPKQ